MNISQLANKHILIAGYGVEGKATKAFLDTYVPSARVDTTDWSDGPDYLNKQADYDVVIKTPGIPPQKIVVPYTTATNIFFANLPKGTPTIGVTGSKGKSTTASLIHHILTSAGKRAALVGNIGTPMLASFHPSPTDTTYVIELSSYQLADIEHSPHISVIVSLFPEHIPYHGTVEEYYNAKKNILAHASVDDYYIYNPSYPLLGTWAQESPAQALPYDTDMPQSPSKLIGAHNQDNMQAAYTVGKVLNITDDAFTSAVASFKPLPHRLQTIGTYQGITFVDDAISTSPESTIAALESINKVKTLFLGGEDRGYDFARLIETMLEHVVEHVVVFPDSGNRLAEELHTKYPDILHIYHAQDMKSAVAYAFEYTPKGTVCLLSSASPSYSLWKNFQEKGDQFQAYIRRYETEKKANA